MRRSVTIYLGRSVTVETVLSAHMSQAVLEELAKDRDPGTDHDETTQFTLRVTKNHQQLLCVCVGNKNKSASHLFSFAVLMVQTASARACVRTHALENIFLRTYSIVVVE